MTENDPEHDSDAQMAELIEQHLEPAPPCQLADLCGLDQLAEKARQTIVQPHRAGYHTAAANSAIIRARSGRGQTNLATAIAGELCAGEFTCVRIDLESDEQARRLQHCEELATLLETAVYKQPLVILIESFECVQTHGIGSLNQRLEEFSLSDDAVVVLGTTEDDHSHRRRRSVVNLQADVTFRIPEPDQQRRKEILTTGLAEMTAETALMLNETSLDFDACADQLDGFEPHRIRQVAKRSVTLAVAQEAKSLTEEHLASAVTQIKNERTGNQNGQVGRQTSEEYSRFSVETPEVTFDDVGGLEETIARIQHLVTVQQRHEELYEQAGFDSSYGLLLAGPPGTGKTLLAKAIANELDRTFLSVKGPEMKHPLYGMTERRIRQLFETADEEAPAVIFFDEFDAIAGERDAMSHDATKSLVATLLTELDGIEDRDDLLVLAATNRRAAIDDAILRPGRLDEVIEIPLPDAEGRADIFAIHTDGLLVATDVTPEWFVSVGPSELTGADIRGICEEAFHVAVKEAGPAQEPVVTRDHIRKGIERIAPSDDHHAIEQGFE